MSVPEPDWREYFLAFKEKHGGKPVELDGRLVFEDGWSYAKDDYRGPEHPPPNEPVLLWNLKRRYWKRRCEVIKGERDRLAQGLENLAKHQLSRNVDIPVAGIETYTDNEGRDRARYAPAPMNWDAYRIRLKHLTEDLVASEQELKTLEGFDPDNAKDG